MGGKKELDISQILVDYGVYNQSGINAMELDRKLRELFEQELDRAREEGYQNCMDDIWEKAKELRSWTEHDGSISATDIEAGLREAYLEIEEELSKLTTK